MSTVMYGFDSLSMVLGIIDSDNLLTALNDKLYQSTVYNCFQQATGVVATFTGAASSTMACFVAGTLVLTMSGLRRIEDIVAGDKILAADPDKLESAEKTVLETYVRKVSKLVHLTINGEKIVTMKNQLKGYALLERNGGVIGGKGKTGIGGGTILGPSPGYTTRNGRAISVLVDMLTHGG